MIIIRYISLRLGDFTRDFNNFAKITRFQGGALEKHELDLDRTLLGFCLFFGFLFTEYFGPDDTDFIQNH